MKTDARTKYTKKIIRECLFKLLKDMPLNKITVKTICDKAEINRSTFYRYYNDVFDLMSQVEAELVNSFQAYAKEISDSSLEKAIEAMMSAVKNNYELYDILISDNADRYFINHMVSDSYELFKSDFTRRYPNLTEVQQEWLYYFIAHGCISIVNNWIMHGMKESPAEVSEFISAIDSLILAQPFGNGNHP